MNQRRFSASLFGNTKMEAIHGHALSFNNEMQPWFTVYIFDIGHPCYGQLASDKSRYPLTSPAEELRFQAWLDLYINFAINAIHLSSFSQVDETTFEKVRISFSDESEILHVNALKCNKTKKITSMAKQAISGLGARPFI